MAIKSFLQHNVFDLNNLEFKHGKEHQSLGHNAMNLNSGVEDGSRNFTNIHQGQHVQIDFAGANKFSGALGVHSEQTDLGKLAEFVAEPGDGMYIDPRFGNVQNESDSADDAGLQFNMVNNSSSSVDADESGTTTLHQNRGVVEFTSDGFSFVVGDNARVNTLGAPEINLSNDQTAIDDGDASGSIMLDDGSMAILQDIDRIEF